MTRPPIPNQTTQLHVDPSVIDLGVGQPQLSLLPLERLGQAAALRFAAGAHDFLQYGAEQGDGYFRLALAEFLNQGYGFPVHPDQLFITNGASSALALICTLYARPGDTIFVEEPTYFLALRIFADYGLRPVAIPVDEDGLSVTALEAALQHSRPAFLYTIPTYQNPSTNTLSAERRTRLVELSREYDFWVVADEVYHFLQYRGAPPPALGLHAEQDRVLSLGSFSKILAPGLRLGWILTSPERAAAFAHSGLLASGGGLNPFTSSIVRSLLDDGGLQTHIAELKQVYTQRSETLANALRNHLPEANFHLPQGGYFFWVRLPGNLDARAIMPHAEQFKVAYRPGAFFSTQQGLANYLRLSFTYYPAGLIEQGVARLGRCLRSLAP